MVEVEDINRMGEECAVATARIHLVVSDRSVRKIGANAFAGCRNLDKVTAPFVEEVGEMAFLYAYNLRHMSLSPNVVVKPYASLHCISLDVVAGVSGAHLPSISYQTRENLSKVRSHTCDCGIFKEAQPRE